MGGSDLRGAAYATVPVRGMFPFEMSFTSSFSYSGACRVFRVLISFSRHPVSLPAISSVADRAKGPCKPRDKLRHDSVRGVVVCPTASRLNILLRRRLHRLLRRLRSVCCNGYRQSLVGSYCRLPQPFCNTCDSICLCLPSVLDVYIHFCVHVHLLCSGFFLLRSSSLHRQMRSLLRARQLGSASQVQPSAPVTAR